MTGNQLRLGTFVFYLDLNPTVIEGTCDASLLTLFANWKLLKSQAVGPSSCEAFFFFSFSSVFETGYVALVGLERRDASDCGVQG